MKRILLLAIVALCISACNSTKTNTDRLMQRLTAYDRYYVTYKGLITVEKDHQYGIVDQNGRVVLPAEYNSYAYYSSLGLITASRDDTTYIFNSNGKLLSSYEGATDISEDYFSDNPELIPLMIGYDCNDITRNHNNITGEYGALISDYEDITSDDDDTTSDCDDIKIGLVGKNGQLVQPFRFQLVSFSNSNIFAIDNDTLFVLDSKGNITFRSTEYDWFEQDDAGNYRICKGRLYGLLDKDKRKIEPCRNRFIEYFPQYGYYIVSDTSGFSHILKRDGTELPLSVKGRVTPINRTLFHVVDDKTVSFLHLDGSVDSTDLKYFIIDESGWLYSIIDKGEESSICLLDSNGSVTALLPPEYENIEVVDSNRAIIYVNDNNKQYNLIIDRNGNCVAQYDNIAYNLGCSCHPVYANFIAVSRNGQWGFIDRHCNEVVPPQYAKAYSSTSDKLMVLLNDGTSALLDSTGHTIITAEGLIDELLPGIYSVTYYENGFGLRSYIVLPDGRTNATPEQREAARRYMQD